MTITADPLRDFERNEEEKEKWLASRPVCDSCGEPIQGEKKYNIDEYVMCEGCAMEFLEAHSEWIEEDDNVI